MTPSTSSQLAPAWQAGFLQFGTLAQRVFLLILIGASLFGGIQRIARLPRALLNPAWSKAKVFSTLEMRSSRQSFPMASVSSYVGLPMLAQATPGGSGENPIYKIFVKALKMIALPIALVFIVKAGLQIYRRESEEALWSVMGAVIVYFSPDIVQYLFGSVS